MRSKLTSTLIIHPKDESTVFLNKVYAGLQDVKLVQGGVTQAQIIDMIISHDRVMMMGHGTSAGLLSVGRFPGAPLYIVDDSFAPLLAERSNSVFIWCNADQFVTHHKLRGFYTGMFVSEVAEATLMGLGSTTQREVDESNSTFVESIAAFSGHGPRMMHAAARHKYGHLATYNQVAKYNHERLYIS
jgi:hypothetical protein